MYFYEPTRVLYFFFNHAKAVNLDYKTVIELLLYFVIILLFIHFKPVLGKEKEFRGKQ